MDDARTALAFADHLAIQLRANFPLIVVDTMEEQRVVDGRVQHGCAAPLFGVQ